MDNKDTLRFAVYTHKLVYDEQLIARSFIVLKRNSHIVGWTDFHKYCTGTSKIRHLQSDDTNRCFAVVMLLNYAFFGKYSISQLADLTSEMVMSFVKDYGLCRLPDDDEDTNRTEKTVKQTIQFIVDFVESLEKQQKNSKVKWNDLFETQETFSKARRKYVERKVPRFEVLYNAEPDPIFRDMPDVAFRMIINEIIRDHKNILMLTALCAFAGLRPSEACNVRRTDSPLGHGLFFEIIDGEVIDIRIDIRKKYCMRSDLKDVGGIKRPRMQYVYRAFLEPFARCYEIYMAYMAGRKYEAEYGALSVNKSGKAYTYSSFRAEFQKAVRACIPQMLQSKDPELVHYGQLLLDHSISPHILRHWFSVQLALMGEDVQGLMYWRGDKSPESALTYIMGKGDLDKQYKKVNNDMFDYLDWKAEKEHDKS